MGTIEIKVPEGKVAKQVTTDKGIIITFEDGDDKNPMRKLDGITNVDLLRFCETAFGDDYAIQILGGAVPYERKELFGRALYVMPNLIVKTFPAHDNKGTVIEFIKKY
jgi:hypothetical protein